MAGGARAAFGGDERRHGPDREEKQQARRAVEKLSGADCDKVSHKLVVSRLTINSWLLKAGCIV